MPDQFALFVRPKAGFAVPRYGTAELLGATVVAPSKRVNDEPIVWDEQRIVPITAAYYAQFRREMDRHIRKGELVQVSREDWQQQVSGKVFAPTVLLTESTTEVDQ
jgi:hypothetical protein